MGKRKYHPTKRERAVLTKMHKLEDELAAEKVAAGGTDRPSTSWARRRRGGEAVS
jgi:hypothetical protein